METRVVSEISLFAGRYELLPLPPDWDTGRSGLTTLARDTQTGKLVVIKRADIASPEFEKHQRSLGNEALALRTARGARVTGSAVPRLIDEGDDEYATRAGVRRYHYLVLEYAEGERLESCYRKLTAMERADILAQFFELLDRAHRHHIANGDVDFKHLFWQSDAGRLTVIDWGNSRHNVTDPADLAFDLARAAEIIFALTTKQGLPPASGPLDLPDEIGLWPDVSPLPESFRSLCSWATRDGRPYERGPCDCCPIGSGGSCLALEAVHGATDRRLRCLNWQN
ncbi:MAG: hypothetical protein HY784_13190 [Chloroflexi bacterium]|nr:hypothetical protein [Chloroflexota bacterium]